MERTRIDLQHYVQGEKTIDLEDYKQKGRPGKRVVASRYSRVGDTSQLVIFGSESPSESFEKLFPRYQITSYRGIPLWGFWEGLRHFSHHRWDGLSISSAAKVQGTIDNMYRTMIGGALRPSSRRENWEYLQKEADIILNTVLPGLRSFSGWRNEDNENYNLVLNELKEAFLKWNLI